MGDLPEIDFKILFETNDFLNLAIYYVKNELNLTPKDAEILLRDEIGQDVEFGKSHLWEEVEVTIQKERESNGKE